MDLERLEEINDEADRIILEGRGTQSELDIKDLVDALIKAWAEIHQLKRELKDGFRVA